MKRIIKTIICHTSTSSFTYKNTRKKGGIHCFFNNKGICVIQNNLLRIIKNCLWCTSYSRQKQQNKSNDIKKKPKLALVCYSQINSVNKCGLCIFYMQIHFIKAINRITTHVLDTTSTV